MNFFFQTEPDFYEEASTSNASDILSEAKNDDYDVADIPATSQTIIEKQKRRASSSPEFQEASKKMSTTFIALNNELTKKQSVEEEDECDLFCKMLAKQIKEYPKLEREEIMYELHGVMINRRRRYNTMQGRP